MNDSPVQHEPRSWQFSVRGLAWLVLYISFMLAWLRAFSSVLGLRIYVPGFYGDCAIAVLLFAWYQLRRPSNCGSAWNLIALAWFLVVADVFYGIVLAFRFMSVGNIDAMARRAQYGVYLSVVSAITLPLYCTMPTLYLLLARYRSRPRPITLWMYVSLSFAIVDVCLFVTLVSIVYGTWG